MTLRDWFAGQALGSSLAAVEVSDPPTITGPDDTENIDKAAVVFRAIAQHVAIQSYAIADAMIAARGGDS